MLYLFAAPVLAVALMQIQMPGCIKELRKLKFGQTMYELGPQTHLNKKGTPNMGGLVIGLVTVVVTVLFAALNYSRLAKNGGELARWWRGGRRREPCEFRSLQRPVGAAVCGAGCDGHRLYRRLYQGCKKEPRGP